jgi:uncharacterized protein
MEVSIGKETWRKLDTMEQWFSKLPGSIVAFSGGVDSSLVLYLARKWQGRERAIGVISRSESLKAKDFELARSFSRQFDIHMEVIVTRELEDERYNRNSIDRCFFCKDHLYHDLQVIRDRYPGFEVVSGTNADDRGDYRPGQKAAESYRVHSPLAEYGLTKDEVRQIARHFELPNWDKPASPCLNSFGFKDVRVRHYGNHGRVEVAKEDLPRLMEMSASVVEKIRGIGFEKVVIDQEGLVSGKMNRVIQSVKR